MNRSFFILTREENLTGLLETFFREYDPFYL